MDIQKEREAFLHEFEKTDQYRQQYGFYKIPLKYDEQKETWNFYDVQAAWEMWQAAKAKSDKKIKLLLCDEHLQKCESPTGIFNSQYPDEEPCLICLAKDSKAQAVPEGFVLVKNVHPDAIVHNQGLGLFKECQVIYGWDGKSKDFKGALNKGFYHGVKLGAKAVLETAMIEAQEQSHEFK